MKGKRENIFSGLFFYALPYNHNNRFGTRDRFKPQKMTTSELATLTIHNTRLPQQWNKLKAEMLETIF